MSTLTLGIIVIIYMFVIAWLGYLGYRQTKNASDYLFCPFAKKAGASTKPAVASTD